VRLIVDQQLPPILAAWFRDQGVDAFHVRELDLTGAADLAIWADAMHDDAVVVSRDEDFVKLLRDRGGARLVWIRVGNCTNANLLAMIEGNWPAIEQRLSDGDRLIELRS
jgi:predicted nuclease of predicted toxin-antitoxin system